MINSTIESLNLQTEAVLNPSIQFNNPLSKNLKAPKSIFLTGATGFLGAYLLEELLQKTTADIYCLIRSSDVVSGQNRIKKHLQLYSLWQEKLSSRIIPVVGDLAQPLFGLTKEHFHELANQIDIIYHNGAWVNSACPYSTLKPTNVLGTQEVLYLASLSQTKPVHFISTVGIFFNSAFNPLQPVKEADIPELLTLTGGYRQSKWVAEQLVMTAQSRGLPACIYRPSRIMGHSQTGINSNFQDALCILLKGCINLKKFPIIETDLNLVPVDYVSQSVVHLSLLDKYSNQTFHLTNSQQINWHDWFDVIDSFGYPLQKVSYDDFLVTIRDYATKYPHDNLYSSLLLLLDSSDTFLTKKKPEFDTHYTLAGLAGTSIICPLVDKKLITIYLKYFHNSGYFPTLPEKSVNSTKTPAFWKAITTSIKSKNQAFAIQPVPRNQNLPLSFAQERLWLIDRLDPGNPVHNLRAVFRLQGLLNITALEQSWIEIIRRHEILRTTFNLVNGQPVQVITNNPTFELQIINLQELSSSEQESEIRRLAIVLAQEPLNLIEGPLLRVKLLCLSAEENLILRITHHIVTDIWSDTVLMRELATLYTAFCTGKPSPLSELPIQYVDFAQSQRQWLQGEVLEAQINYWKQQLSGDISPLQLPTDFSSSQISSYRGAFQSLALSQELTENLKTLSHKAGVSLFVTLLAGFQMLLYQYSGQEDIILSSPIAGRQQNETKKLIGYFSNLVLLRTNLGQNPSFLELLSRVSRVTLEAQEFQHLSFQQLETSVNISSNIFSRVMFTLQNVLSLPEKLGEVNINLVEMNEGISNFDLSLSMKEKQQQLIAIIRYKTDLFQESTILEILQNFQILLTDIIADPERKLLDLPLLRSVKTNIPVHQPEIAYIAPTNQIEETIAAIWQGVLGVEKIGIHTNFFDLGGRSLAMIRICQQIQQICVRELGSESHSQISVGELFQHPTISGMTQVLYKTRKEVGSRD